MNGSQKAKQRRGKSWSQQELLIVDENLDLSAEQLALLLPLRTPSGIAKKRAERHGRRTSKTAERGCWSVQDEAICLSWNAVFERINKRLKAKRRKRR